MFVIATRPAPVRGHERSDRIPRSMVRRPNLELRFVCNRKLSQIQCHGGSGYTIAAPDWKPAPTANSFVGPVATRALLKHPPQMVWWSDRRPKRISGTQGNPASGAFSDDDATESTPSRKHISRYC